MNSHRVARSRRPKEGSPGVISSEDTRPAQTSFPLAIRSRRAHDRVRIPPRRAGRMEAFARRGPRASERRLLLGGLRQARL
jgi:hypothetical protein